jgi:hypothetical protein
MRETPSVHFGKFCRTLNRPPEPFVISVTLHDDIPHGFVFAIEGCVGRAGATHLTNTGFP